MNNTIKETKTSARKTTSDRFGSVTKVTTMETKNKGYDLIKADSSITLEWNEQETLTVYGSGTCELGEVRGNLQVMDSAQVTVQSIAADAWSCHDSSLTAVSVKGAARCFDASTLTVGGVKI